MTKLSQVEYSDKGHEEILESVLGRHRLQVLKTFRSDNSVCSVATSPADEKLFVKIKGYRKNKENLQRLRRAVSANRMARRIQGDIVPRLIEFKAFERSDVLWMTTLSLYGGEPFSRGLFFAADEALVDDAVVGRLRRALEVIQSTPAGHIFYGPERVSGMIRAEFGRRVASRSPIWTSGHCDFHWGNILQGGRHLVDWDMFALAPKGFDTASMLLFSASNPRLFSRLHRAFADHFDHDAGRVAVLFAAARLLRLMKLDAFAALRAHESDVREAVEALAGPALRRSV